MPPEDIFYPLLALSFTLIVMWTLLSYFKWKQQHSSAPKDTSLATSELKALMQEAVAEANTPLVARLDALEDRLDGLATPRLPEHTPPALEAAER